jgi:hypothetical protein
MKKYLTLTIAIMMFVAVMAVGTQRVRARISFAFNVGDKSLPAGEYTIAVLNPTSDRKVLQIRSTDGRLSAIIQTNERNGGKAEQAKLVFNRYGERYFFAQAQMGGDAMALAAVKSKLERNTSQTIARNERKTRVVIVAS